MIRHPHACIINYNLWIVDHIQFQLKAVGVRADYKIPSYAWENTMMISIADTPLHNESCLAWHPHEPDKSIDVNLYSNYFFAKSAS